MNGRYQAAVEAVFGMRAEATDEVYEVRDAARECDRLGEQLVTDARYMAERFERFAAAIAEGRMVEPPHGYSTLRDIDRHQAEFQARVQGMEALARAVGGLEKAKALRAALETARGVRS